jgi:hypothetical protein
MSFVVEWLPGASVVGLVAVVCVPHLGLIVLAVVLLAAAASLVALAGTDVAVPFLIGRVVWRRLQVRTAVNPAEQGHSSRLRQVTPVLHSGFPSGRSKERPRWRGR